MSKASLQAAFVLHHRPFRDTSVIADLLTPDFGRIGVVARGVRTAKSTRRVLLQPFRPLLASWTGRSSLSTLTSLEESGLPVPLSGQALACAYYVTELALCLVPEHEPNATAFALYARTLSNLAECAEQEPALRLFEIELLDSLGFLPDFARSGVDSDTIDEAGEYLFNPESGIAMQMDAVSRNTVPISGRTLHAMAQRDFSDSKVLAEAKRLMRQLLQVHLGNRPLKSREVFEQYRHVQKNES